MVPYENHIRIVGKQLIKIYKEKKIIHCGINGPYDDPETRIRNLSHLIIISAIEIVHFGCYEYLAVLKEMLEDLLASKDVNGVYKMRMKKGKDECNGVIGHAWIIEALVYGFKATGDFQYISEANRIAKMHKFQSKLGVWGRPLMGNADESLDFTLNHQIWYAASLVELNQILNDNKWEKQYKRFMEKLNDNLLITKEGRIAHNIYTRQEYITRIKQQIKKEVMFVRERIGKSSMAYKEEGYHLFNLMALARIYSLDQGNIFFNTKKFKQTLSYINSGLLLKGLNDKRIDLDLSLNNNISNSGEKDINIYGYPYNVPGFEICYVAKIFGDLLNEEIVNECLKKQMDLTYDNNKQAFGKKCHDKNTINYRIYEFYRYMEVAN